jgi:hypothetical protein
MRNRLILGLVILALASAGSAMAQGELSGRVIYEDQGLPGVRVSISSPALQQNQSTVTNAAGDYIFKALPAGDYKVRFELSSFAVLENDVRISTTQPRRLDAVMYPEAMQEEIVVTGQFENVSTGSQGSATVEQSTLEKLPVLRTLTNAALLNAGVTNTGPNDAISISGAQSWENLFTVNGVVINDNIRGTPSEDLIIEDAVLETTTITSSASAEYGRFSGGVVNVVTKTGGNDFSGSFRVNVANESWNGETPLTTSQQDKNNYIYEATLGGRIIRDALWFFLAGRDSENAFSGQIFTASGNGEQFGRARNETRYEGRLTASFGPNHRVSGYYIDREAEDINYYPGFFPPSNWDAVLDSRTLPHTGWSATYTGVLTDNFFLEGMYAEREFQFVGAGGKDPNLGTGTPVLDYLTGSLMNAPWWCGICNPEIRANENYFAKASWFFSGAGTHDLVFGIDSYHDILQSDNWQSATGWNIGTWTPQDYSVDGEPLMAMPTYGGYVIWSPVLNESLGSDFTTNSAFVNDTWRINDKLTVNLGVRYDANDGTDQGGAKVTDDSRFSPRLSASYDVKGDGKLVIVGGYSRYVVGMAQGVADAGSAAGGVVYNTYLYDGPDVIAGTPEYPTNADAVEAILDHFVNVYGGPGNTDLLYYAYVPGLSPKINPDLDLSSPYGDEFTIGASYRLGTRGVIRADIVHREYGDFYATDYSPNRWVTDEVTGLITVDLGLIQNLNQGLKREYNAIQSRFDYRIGSRWALGANYTYSKTEGNTNLETAGSGPGTSGIISYVEYKDPEWNTPMGLLATDQTHKFNAYVSWDAISTNHHNLNFSLLQSYVSGTPYSATQTISTVPYVGDPASLGYRGTSLGAQTYFFSDRGAFRTDAVSRTDIAINYSFFLNLFGGQLEMFLQPEVINVFNENAVVAPNNTIIGPRQGMEAFNPFTETPVEGVNWDYGDNFGEADIAVDFQQPRTVRFSVGLRF